MKRYENFRDPLGLVKRMLASGDRAAYATLVRAATRIGILPIDLLLSIVERRTLRRTAVETHWPVLLIVGGSRTGTTLLFQILSQHLEVSPTTNVVDLFPRSPLTASRMLGALHGSGRKAEPFHSYFGVTANLREPNDAFEVWNRWLGSDRYEPPAAISKEAQEEMRSFFAAWATVAQRPVLNKNNRNTGALTLLADALPTAHFIVARREPLFAAQSLLIARPAIQGDAKRGWGFAAEITNGDPIDSVARQVAAAEGIIAKQTAAVDPGRVTHVGYEDLCADPARVVADLGKTLGIEYDVDGLAPLVASRDVRLPGDQFELLRESVRHHLGA